MNIAIYLRKFSDLDSSWGIFGDKAQHKYELEGTFIDGTIMESFSEKNIINEYDGKDTLGNNERIVVLINKRWLLCQILLLRF